MPRNSEASSVGDRRPPPSAVRAHIGEQQAGRELDQSREDGDVQRVAEPAPGADEPERVLRLGQQRREMVDPTPCRPRARRDDPSRPRPQALDLDVPVARAQVSGRVQQRCLEPRQQGVALHAEREHQRVAGRRPLGLHAAGDLELPSRRQNEEPGDERRGQERERQQVELPGADDPCGQVRAAGDGEKGHPPGGGARHLSGLGTGTVSRSRAITASSVSPCILVSGARMMR